MGGREFDAWFGPRGKIINLYGGGVWHAIDFDRGGPEEAPRHAVVVA